MKSTTPSLPNGSAAYARMASARLIVLLADTSPPIAYPFVLLDILS